MFKQIKKFLWLIMHPEYGSASSLPWSL